MAKKKHGFQVNVCSVCDDFKLTVGEQSHGGVRYCRDCIKHTLAWVQFGEEGQAVVQTNFDKQAERPAIKKALADVGNLNEEERKNYAKNVGIGESIYRLRMSQLEGG